MLLGLERFIHGGGINEHFADISEPVESEIGLSKKLQAIN